jgi:hypothetical protein
MPGVGDNHEEKNQQNQTRDIDQPDKALSAQCPYQYFQRNQAAHAKDATTGAINKEPAIDGK